MKIKTQNPLPKTISGSVCKQLKKCGKPSCKCTRGELHGPYYYYFYRVGGVLHKRYLKADDVTNTRIACEQHRAILKRRRNLTGISLRHLRSLVEELRASEAILSTS